MKIIDAVEAYDALAPHYKTISAAHSRYLEAVEKIIVLNVAGAESLLDIGAGDAIRTHRIARSAGIPQVIALEPSPAMRAGYPPDLLVWECRAEAMPASDRKFDVILCLWNVLGHVATLKERVAVLTAARGLLNPGGTIFVDVNHRYNAAAYGWGRTLYRVVHDYLYKSDENGGVHVVWNVGSQIIHTRGHVFTHHELESMLGAAGLSVCDRWVINYCTGALSRFSFQGNLLYRIAAAPI